MTITKAKKQIINKNIQIKDKRNGIRKTSNFQKAQYKAGTKAWFFMLSLFLIL